MTYSDGLPLLHREGHGLRVKLQSLSKIKKTVRLAGEQVIISLLTWIKIDLC